MDVFTRLHPVSIFCYYTVTLILVIYVGHPLLYFMLLVMTFADYCWNVGKKRACKAFVSSMGATVFCVIINPLFNHRGVTTLFILGGMRITKEAVEYGLYMAVLLLGSIFLFSSFSHVMSSEKIMTLAGRHFPSLALLFSMVLRLVPKVKKDFKEMTSLHGNCPKVWMAVIGKQMEDSVERSLAMKNKKYGAGRRTSYYYKKCGRTDWILLGAVVIMVFIVVFVSVRTPVSVWFFPSIHVEMYPIVYWLLWMMYLAIPMGIKGKEEVSWLISRQKIIDFTIRDK